MPHGLRTPRCSGPAVAQIADRCWPRRPSLRVVQGKAVVEQLGALLTPVVAPVAAAVGAVAVEAGKGVEGLGSGPDARSLSTVGRPGGRPLTPATNHRLQPDAASRISFEDFPVRPLRLSHESRGVV